MTETVSNETERYTASYRLNLPGSLTLDEVDDLTLKLREMAGAWLSQDGKSFGIQWHEKSAWHLRGLVEQHIAELEANFPAIKFDDRDEDTWTVWIGEAEGFA